MIKIVLKDGTEGKLDENNLYVEFSKNVFTKIKIDDIKSIILREDEEIELNDYEIKRINNLSLCKKTLFGKEPTDLDIDICQWDSDFKTRWIISTFIKTEEGYDVMSIGDRILDSKINALDYMKIISLGFEWLEEHSNKDNLEE